MPDTDVTDTDTGTPVDTDEPVDTDPPSACDTAWGSLSIPTAMQYKGWSASSGSYLVALKVEGSGTVCSLTCADWWARPGTVHAGETDSAPAASFPEELYSETLYVVIELLPPGSHATTTCTWETSAGPQTATYEAIY